jgi:AraC-like DNA-binding protein
VRWAAIRTVLEEAFQRLYGRTIHEFVVVRRVDVAKLYLAETDDKIEYIAALVGFSAAAFYRQFQRLTSMTPSAFRRAGRRTNGSAAV